MKQYNLKKDQFLVVENDRLVIGFSDTELAHYQQSGTVNSDTILCVLLADIIELVTAEDDYEVTIFTKDDLKVEINFKNRDEAQRFAKDNEAQLLQVGLMKEFRELTLGEVMSGSLLAMLFVAALGSGITYFVYYLVAWEPERPTIHKGLAAILYTSAKTIGYIPFAIITGLILLILFWQMISSIMNRPVRTAYKR